MIIFQKKEFSFTMTLSIYIMIYSGSALMVYNIIRYYGFTKKCSGWAKASGADLRSMFRFFCC